MLGDSGNCEIVIVNGRRGRILRVHDVFVMERRRLLLSGTEPPARLCFLKELVVEIGLGLVLAGRGVEDENDRNDEHEDVESAVEHGEESPGKLDGDFYGDRKPRSGP